MNTIAAYLGLEDILLDAEVANKEQLFLEIGRLMGQKHTLQEDLVANGLSRRERVSPFPMPGSRISNEYRLPICA
jgi:mannitol/fructose-specific phosphotransferase system IIA component (Ntr-type)